MVDRIPVLEGIQVHYDLHLDEDAPRDKVERALTTHVDKCPTAQSIKGAVEVTWTADVHYGEERVEMSG
jgi:uncharacterized OsmC-like protein